MLLRGSCAITAAASGVSKRRNRMIHRIAVLRRCSTAAAALHQNLGSSLDILLIVHAVPVKRLLGPEPVQVLGRRDVLPRLLRLGKCTLQCSVAERAPRHSPGARVSCYRPIPIPGHTTTATTTAVPAHTRHPLRIGRGPCGEW